ncbi:glutamate-5-semialdehyde dehydrogenase [Pseudoalteromonas tunicata]|jgi:glutamate-5-semialdehyde dehydrogenase|uniref:Gamma-glutamyl phosphate reductase n=1 Tax=Pseudoalteromonas tunicata D2 TaxID=87626 RepID=A4C726_9GAMM|nr:glutamate-5-semialdehyde dehydrogenase [Pseudoalteromonas tunicata]ATC95751.1 glutamate-5-semialdehyde dehydrogenase [Pseudoalteromonas tunicata]AXT31304.1 glutamate-5-semialdehyde dehydrogenase [Pseudoalteromonas tunicata]EAR29780.1 gamma-glutamyl phosphate reductase [Pseudoalteromonas tunicata D2]MDP4983821.1 glutamate-5-semialdehyde dehydrogenase [Pseudoalteromonas tunicata]
MLEQLAQDAQIASYQLATLSSRSKNQALKAIINQLVQHQSAILAANQLDIAAGKEAGLTDALLDRLLLTAERLAGMCQDIEQLIALSDPIGEEYQGKQLESGLFLKKRTVPLGVIGVIYEARPNVTIDIACLALKTGNAAILRGGKETLNSNILLVKLIQTALVEVGINAQAVQLIADPDRALIYQLLKLDKYIDMIIPRGGQTLQQVCVEHSTIPVITGGIGICHLFVDESADVEKAIAVIRNAKVQRPSVCNALDTVLIHQSIAYEFINRLVPALAADGVSFRGCPQSVAINATCQVAQASDFDTEWLSLTLGIKVVDDLSKAVSHIRAHSSGHSDGILTQSLKSADQFVAQVNSAAVYVNASTRFTDGAQFGLGAEVAVSTQKLHARGPMGLDALTTYKWIGIGDGLIRS